ncbi:MAG: hypothetical protein ACR2NM_12445 [Bythopirellula sp.]
MKPVLIIAVGLWLDSSAQAARFDGKLTIRVVDDQSGQPIAARMLLRNGRDRLVKVRAPKTVAHGDYFVFEGEVTLELRQGPYKFLIEAGPEYQTRPGHFSIDRHAEDSTEVRLRRRVDMQAAGWWAGDLEARHRQQDLRLLMSAARVNLVPTFVQANVHGKCLSAKRSPAPPKENFGPYLLGPNYSLDHRRGGGLLVFETEAPQQSFDICSAKSADSSLTVLHRASAAGATTVALTPFAWDLPIWIASGELDAVQIIHRHALVDDVVDNESWGRKRDKTFFPGKTGNGRWSETIYHHMLNCGLRIPPAAGSGSGVNRNPLGTNRVYVHCGEEFTRDGWFAGLREGKVMVTNGPLLRTEVSGHPPGHQFHLDRGETREFQIALGLAFYEQAPVEYLEIIKDGRVEHEIRLNELAKKNGRLPPLQFDDSGWFLVRAMTSSTNNYQFATTGPYYVQANYQPRISRTSVQFFLDWLDHATKQFADNAVVLADIQQARPFWEDRLAQANTD